MPRLFWKLFDHRPPLRPPRHAVDELRVVKRRVRRTGGFADALRRRRLAVLEHGAERQHSASLEAGLGCEQTHDAVAELSRHRQPLRSVRADEDGNADRRWRLVAGRRHELRQGALDLHRLPGEQAAQLREVASHVGPRQRLLAHRHAPGEAGAERDGEAARRDLLQRRDRRRLRYRMAQVGDQDGRAKTDAARRVRDACQRHPDVGVQRRRIVQPDPLVAERLAQPRVLDCVRARRERARNL